ncbi:hypothetical protein BDA99DRAFT_543522 [Phascolomyces articulosus]|uniref:Uncharacterized protein n=1 Tax=Phascolomyces articulosus TaxID=60185 RepID=A0AAD5K0S3_9FUNG|nr:hypothetical protein BDA99DRAFT_543522 [Phascolomyces articulosus]
MVAIITKVGTGALDAKSLENIELKSQYLDLHTSLAADANCPAEPMEDFDTIFLVKQKWNGKEPTGGAQPLFLFGSSENQIISLNIIIYLSKSLIESTTFMRGKNTAEKVNLIENLQDAADTITPSQFSVAHWETIKQIHRTSCEEISAGRYKPALGARELFAKFAGISTGSAGKAIRICKADEKKVISSKLGRPKKEILRQEYNLVREYIGERNAKDIVPTYLKYNRYSYSKCTVQRYLTKMNFKFGKGNKLNIMHDTPANIGNLNANNMSIIPEVFLDESNTPPYHCELQPIERVRGIVKNRIAFDPEENPTGGSVRTSDMKFNIKQIQNLSS